MSTTLYNIIIIIIIIIIIMHTSLKTKNILSGIYNRFLQLGPHPVLHAFLLVPDKIFCVECLTFIQHNDE